MRKSLKNVIVILLCCTMALSLFACGTSNTSASSPSTPASSASSAASTPSAAPAAPAKDTLTVAISQDSGTLDPMFNIGWDCMNALRMIYEPLWEFGSDGKMINVLATGIDMISPTVWQIHLREGVKFANGNPFNADDVLFTFYRANNRPGASALLTTVLTDQCKKIDDYTVEIVFDQFRVGSEYNVFPSIYMFDKESFDENTVVSKTNGTGPYVLTEQVINSQWVVTRRDDYWGDVPALKTITFKVLAEDSQKVNAIQTGSIDISNVPFQDIEYVKSLKNIDVSLTHSGTSKAIYMNMDPHTPFNNNDDARKAVALAIDRQAIVDVVYSGYATVSRMPLAVGKFDQEDRFLDQGIYKTGQDIAKAKELAQSSGLVNKEILLINNGASDSMVVAELIQESLREIGVTVKIWTLDTGSWLGVMFDPTQWDMAVDFTIGNSVVQGYDMWARLHGGGSFVTNPWVGSERFFEIDTIALGEPDQAKRNDLVMEMTTILADGLIWYSLCDMEQAVAYNKGIKNFQQLNTGSIVYSRLSW